MNERIIEIAKKNNGYITNDILKKNNIPTNTVYRLAEKNVFTKVDKGIFVMDNFIEDPFFNIHLLYSNVIFCGETALYLNNLSNAQFSRFFGIVPYKSSVPNNDSLHISRSRKSTINIGVADVITPYGNFVKCYDKERCICDLFIRPDYYDYEDRIYAINEYKNNYLDLPKLYDYAKKLNVYEKVKNVFEVIKWN